MRRLTVALLMGAAAFAQSVEAPRKPSVSGRVLRQDGNPLRYATVTLLGRERFTITADAKGAFTFEIVPPGKYSLIAQRLGYASVKFGAPAPLALRCIGVDHYGNQTSHLAGGNDAVTTFRQCINEAPGTALTVTPNIEIKDLIIRIPQSVVIRGKVTNQDAEAVPGQVAAMFREPGVRNSRMVATASVDSDGNYTLDDLPPGRYYLLARIGNVQALIVLVGGSPSILPVWTTSAYQDQMSKAPSESDVSTYYPSTPDELAAVPVEVKAGEALRDVDIVLRRGQVFSVRGALVMPPNTPAAKIALTMAPGDGAGDSYNTNRAISGADGAFVFSNVVPGAYVITCRTQALFGSRALSVAAADVEGVNVTMRPGVQLAGAVRVEGVSSGSWPAVALAATDGTSSSDSARVQADGTFTFPASMAPIEYAVRVTALPPGTYLKSIRYGDQDALHKALNLEGGGSAKLEIVISTKTAAVTGKITNAAGDAVKGAQVTAWAAKPEAAGRLHSANSDQNGNFEIADLGPGDYFVAAWEQLPPALADDAGFLARFQDAAVAAAVEEGARATADLKLIPRERIDAEMTKLR